MNWAREGGTMPVSSVARLCSIAGLPFQFQAARNRVSAFGRIGSLSTAGAQLLPPSADTSTERMRPLPDHARAENSWKPGPLSRWQGEGGVIMDLTSSGDTN